MECSNQCYSAVKCLESIVKIILMVFICAAIISYIECGNAYLKQFHQAASDKKSGGDKTKSSGNPSTDLPGPPPAFVPYNYHEPTHTLNY